MSNLRSDELVQEYLHRLDQHLELSPSGRREMLREQIAAHISDARAELGDDDPEKVASILDDLGDPSQIAWEGSAVPSVRRRARASTWLGIGVVGAVAIAALVVAMDNNNSSSFTTIPIVAGDSPNAAKGVLDAAGLRVESSYVVPSAVVPAGDVVATYPQGHSRVHSGSKVSLALSQGPSVMPEVVGLSSSAAIRELRERDLRAVVVRVHRAGSSWVVIAQAPIHGTAMTGGTWVRIDVASDSSAVPKTVPNVLGEPASWALAELRSLGLRVDLRVVHRQICGTVVAETLPGVPIPSGGVYVAIAECES
jgi:hypothetical protein